MKLPQLCWIILRNFRVTQLACRGANELRYSVARHVSKRRRLVIRHGHNYISRPRPGLALWISKPPRLLTRETDDDDVRPSIAIHVMRERKKVLRVSSDVERLCFVVLMPVGKLRTRIPIRSRNNVHHAVVVEIAKVRALAKKLVRKLNLLKRMQRVFLSSTDRRSGE